MQKAFALLLAVAIVGTVLLTMNNSLPALHFQTKPTIKTSEPNSPTSSINPKNPTTGPIYQQAEPVNTAPTINSSGIHKCSGAGKTIYSDAPCPQGTKTAAVEMHYTHGTVSPDRKTIQTTRERIREDIRNDVGPNATIQTPQPDQATCNWLKNRADQLDAASRQLQPSWSQDQIRFEKQRIRDQQFRMQCN